MNFSSRVVCLNVFFVPSQIFAQNNAAGICDQAFSQGIRSQYSLLTENQQFTLYRDRLCNTHFDTYQSMSDAAGSLGVSIPLADDLLGLKGSASDKESQFKQSYSNFCASNFYSSDQASKYKLDIGQINADLVRAWNSCQTNYFDANKRGVYVSFDPIGNLDQFLAYVQVKDDQVGRVKIKSINPDNVTCSHAGAPVKLGVTAVDSKSFGLTWAIIYLADLR